ncbi:unnamed protein product, partial [Staurois parvus]
MPVPPSAHQCCQSVLSVSATNQRHPSVPPISAHTCCLSVPIIAAYHCSIISASSSMPTSVASSVQPISAAYPCHLISAHQCCLSVQHHQCTSM